MRPPSVGCGTAVARSGTSWVAPEGSTKATRVSNIAPMIPGCTSYGTAGSAGSTELNFVYSTLSVPPRCSRLTGAPAATHGVAPTRVTPTGAAPTVYLRFTAPDPNFLFKVAGFIQPAPAGTPRTRIAAKPVPGTGPYRVEEFAAGERLLLTRNELFDEWSEAAQPDGYPERIAVRMHDEPDARVSAVLAGHADVAIEVASATSSDLYTHFASQVRRHGQPDTKFLSFNVQRPPFDDVRARRALNLAIDRAAVARRFGGRDLSSPTCQLLPPSFPAYEAYCPWTGGPRDGRWHRSDIRRARVLVRASRTARMAVDFVTRRASTAGPAAAAEVATALRRIGYRPRVEILSNAELERRRSDTDHAWNVTAFDWVADYPSPGQFLDLFLRCSNYHPEDPSLTTNFGGFCDPGFDRLVARAEQLQATDPARAEQVWSRADRLAVDEAALAPLVNTGSVEVVSPRTGHFTLDATGQPRIDQLWVR